MARTRPIHPTELQAIHTRRIKGKTIGEPTNAEQETMRILRETKKR
jgi:hypothetical protein